MKKSPATLAVLAFLCLLCLIFPSEVAADELELTGTIIYQDDAHEQTNPVANAFDNNINTYFNSRYGYKNWIGLDLGAQHIITKIVYAPRIDEDYRTRLTLGVFEGANNPDFGDAIPLHIIPGLTEREFITQNIVCTRGFRYLRFVFPPVQESGKSSYMSELKFYGHAGTGDDTQLPCIANLPVVSIHTVGSKDITSKEVYIQGIVSVISADGKTVHSDSLDVRGRGNNSWSYPKKPYRMKLYKKASLLGLPAKEKNWTLINNYGDKTLMRNVIAFEISRKIEMPYTPAIAPVNVFLNGEYKGCYQLCDQVEVNKKRLETDELEPTDVSLPNLSGGYLLEIDSYASGEPVWFTSTGNNIPVTIKYPKDDEIVPAQRSYIEAHFNKLVTSVNAANYANESNGFRKYLDTPSFLRRFLAVEFAGNTDSYWSYYIYKKRNDDKFYSSPIWDLDLSFENDWRTYPINTRTGNQWIYATTGSAATGMRNLLNRLFTDRNLVQEMEDIYAFYRNNHAIEESSLLHFVDSMALMLDESQKLNFTRWSIMNEKVHENPVIHGSYEAEVANVKNYIAGRIAWLDNKLNYSAPQPPYIPPEGLISVSDAGGTGKRIVNIHSYSGKANDKENPYKLLIGEPLNTNGDKSNKWCDNTNETPWVIFSLTDIYHIDSIAFRDGLLMNDVANASSYSVYVSMTGTGDEDFELALHQDDVAGQNIKQGIINKDARYIKFMPRASNSGVVRIYGFDIYGSFAQEIDREGVVSVGKTILNYHNCQSDRETPANILDGNIHYSSNGLEVINDSWAFNRSEGDAWVIIDLEDCYEINQFVVYDSEDWIKGYRVSLSDTGDEDDWRLVAEKTFADIHAATKPILLADASKGRFVRLEVPLSKQAVLWNRIHEFEVYGKKWEDTSVTAGLQIKRVPIYPNPVRQGSPVYIPEAAMATVYSLQGALIDTQQIDGDGTPLSTEKLLPGCYILRLSDNAGTHLMKLIVK
jgi:hypothetical protein